MEVVSAGEGFIEEQIQALAEIYSYLRAIYGITRIIRHYDVTGKRCSAPYVDAGEWATLKARITGGSGWGSPRRPGAWRTSPRASSRASSIPGGVFL